MPRAKLAGRLVDVRPDRLDIRDREYLPKLVSLPDEYPDPKLVDKLLPRYQEHKLILDQGDEGACTGFGLAAVINYLLWRRKNAAAGANAKAYKAVDLVSPRMLYHLARIYDEWAGEDYEGSSCRGAMKGWHRHGVCTDKIWPYRDAKGAKKFIQPKKGWAEDAAERTLGAYYRINKSSVNDMQSAIHEVGAIYCSSEVHGGWDMGRKQSLPVIPYERKADGGHAFAIVGYTRDGFIVQNSWGSGWGYKGFAVVTYEDWITHGMDAWVAVMGVPVALKSSNVSRSMRSLRESAVGRGGPPVRSVLEGTKTVRLPNELQPWDEARAYRHTVVLGNEGVPLNRFIDVETASDAVTRVALDLPKAWLQSRSRKRIAVYAHGGLNDEDASIRRVQVMAPYFLAHGVYPLFFTWRTGALNAIGGIVGDAWAELTGEARAEGWFRDKIESLVEAAKEARDRTIEVAAERLLGKAIWQQMKQNAGAAALKQSGAVQVAAHLNELRARFPDLEAHFVGHSAGSILLGHLMKLLWGGEVKLESLTLYAPACTLQFALSHIAGSVEQGLLGAGDIFLENLDDERERADSVGPYGKSLLYLVSRAFEVVHKTPLLGMQCATRLEPDREGSYWSEDVVPHVEAWRKFARKGVEVEYHDKSRAKVWDGAGHIDLAHGSFDNDVDVVKRTLERVSGAKVKREQMVLRGF